MVIERSKESLSVRDKRIQVSENGRYFVDQHGEPFFYLADTAWTMFKRLDRADVERYLRNRAARGFTVIQAYVLRGLELANVEGELPLVGRDPTRRVLVLEDAGRNLPDERTGGR